MVPFERALVSSCRPPIVTFPLSLRVSEIIIAAFVLQHATFSHPIFQDCQPGQLRKTIFPQDCVSAVQPFKVIQVSKVTDFGTNRKRVCNFLSLIRSYLALFRRYAGFLLRSWPHPYSTPILGVFPLHQIAHVGVIPRISQATRPWNCFQGMPTYCDHGT